MARTLDLTRDTIDFGSVAPDSANTTVDLTITNNIADSFLTVTDINVTGAFALQSPTQINLNGGESATLSIAIDAHSLGSKVGAADFQHQRKLK